jgi:hypothetical protein
VAKALAVGFALYAFLGKGFAYASFGSIYVGEILLGLGLLALIATQRFGRLLHNPYGLLLLAFGMWQAACTVPYLSTYGIDALRDAVTWGYSGFAWIAAALVLRLNGALGELITRYRRFSRWFVVLGPISFLVSLFLANLLPVWPGTRVTIPFVKGDDLLSHLAGIAAFVISGLAAPLRWVLIPLVAGAAVAGVASRGGMLGFLMGIILAVSAVRGFRRGAQIGAALLLVLLVSIALDPHVDIPGSPREWSPRQMIQNLLSISGSSADASLEGSKQWRLAWWSKIVGYTFGGPYFWTGKGYGINLADDDGFQTNGELHDLRSPHNSHLTLLARSGVPGLLLWLSVQFAWLLQLARDFRRARRRGQERWAGLFISLLSYWVAFFVGAAFDVMLEGPTSGIPFWIIIGVGWGAHILFNRQRQPSPTAISVQRATC